MVLKLRKGYKQLNRKPTYCDGLCVRLLLPTKTSQEPESLGSGVFELSRERR
jgi:hypothetical protein